MCQLWRQTILKFDQGLLPDYLPGYCTWWATIIGCTQLIAPILSTKWSGCETFNFTSLKSGDRLLADGARTDKAKALRDRSRDRVTAHDKGDWRLFSYSVPRSPSVPWIADLHQCSSVLSPTKWVNLNQQGHPTTVYMVSLSDCSIIVQPNCLWVAMAGFAGLRLHIYDNLRLYSVMVQVAASCQVFNDIMCRRTILTSAIGSGFLKIKLLIVPPRFLTSLIPRNHVTPSRYQSTWFLSSHRYTIPL